MLRVHMRSGCYRQEESCKGNCQYLPADNDHESCDIEYVGQDPLRHNAGSKDEPHDW